MDKFYLNHYQYCPQCSGKLVATKESLQCQQCQFTIYDNPALAVILLFHQKGQVLLSQRKFDPKAGAWDSPGGFVQSGETAEQAARREGKEELGVEIELDCYLGSLTGKYDEAPVLDLIFLAKLKQQNIKPQDDVAALKWFSFDQLPKNFAFARTKQAIQILQTYLKKESHEPR